MTSVTEDIKEENLEGNKYRFLHYERMGFSTEQAQILSEMPHLSVANVREQYINKGCTPDLAYQILHA